MTIAATRLRDQALLMLEGKGSILDVARRVTRVLERDKIEGAVIGGVAVVLHGYVRTTADVDVYVSDHADQVAASLKADGFEFDAAASEFRADNVPVHLVTDDQAKLAPQKLEHIEEVRTVSLADLINLKLDSGIKSVARAQDLADVVGLIRHRRLTGEFARHVHKSLRSEFRKLVRAVAAG